MRRNPLLRLAVGGAGRKHDQRPLLVPTMLHKQASRIADGMCRNGERGLERSGRDAELSNEVLVVLPWCIGFVTRPTARVSNPLRMSVAYPQRSRTAGARHEPGACERIGKEDGGRWIRLAQSRLRRRSQQHRRPAPA